MKHLATRQDLIASVLSGQDIMLDFAPICNGHNLCRELDQLRAAVVVGDAVNLCGIPTQAISAGCTFANNGNGYQYYVNVHWSTAAGIVRQNIRFPMRFAKMRRKTDMDMWERDGGPEKMKWWATEDAWEPAEENPGAAPFKARVSFSGLVIVSRPVNACLWNEGNYTIRLPMVSAFDQMNGKLWVWDVYAYLERDGHSGPLVSFRRETWGPGGLERVDVGDVPGTVEVLVRRGA